MKNLDKIIGAVVGLCVIVGAMFGAVGVFATNDRVDQVSVEVQLVKEEMRRNELIRRLHKAEERIWGMDEKFGFGCERCSAELKEEYQLRKQEVRDIERELDEGKKEG